MLGLIVSVLFFVCIVVWLWAWYKTIKHTVVSTLFAMSVWIFAGGFSLWLILINWRDLL